MREIFIFGTSISLFEGFLFFFLYGFLGWVSEVVYAAIRTKAFVNRGFLSGPICPLYGTGALLVMLVCDSFTNNLFLVFLISTVLTSTVEFLTGLALEKHYHRKWWDYSKRRFNIKGYICLEFSIVWGLLCTFVVGLLNKPFFFLFDKMNYVVGIILIIFLLAVFIVDIVLAVIAATKFKHRFEILSQLQEQIKKSSDYIGKGIFNSYEQINDKYEEFAEKHNLIEKYNTLLKKIKGSRVVKAFPNLIRHKDDTNRKNKKQ